MTDSVALVKSGFQFCSIPFCSVLGCVLPLLSLSIASRILLQGGLCQRLLRATSSLHRNQVDTSAPRETKARSCHKTQWKTTLTRNNDRCHCVPESHTDQYRHSYFTGNNDRCHCVPESHTDQYRQSYFTGNNDRCHCVPESHTDQYRQSYFTGNNNRCDCVPESHTDQYRQSYFTGNNDRCDCVPESHTDQYRHSYFTGNNHRCYCVPESHTLTNTVIHTSLGTTIDVTVSPNHTH